MQQKKIVSLKDIARIAGVAPSTVSAVLNGKTEQARISMAVADKVLKVIEQTGYQPNHTAVSLRTGKTKIIGLIVEDISNGFFAAMAKQIEARVYAYGYKIVYCSTDGQEQKGRELISILYRQVDGLIITPVPGMEKDMADVLEHNKPVVLIDRFVPALNITACLVDNEDGIMQGMQHLMGKGYRKVAFVTIAQPMVQMQLREKSYISCMQQHALEPMVLKIPYNSKLPYMVDTITSFLQATHAEAVFFATNYLGLAGLESIQRCGFSIPDDIAVICFDDNETFRLHTPGITAIEQPIEAIADEAIHLLMRSFKGEIINGDRENLLRLFPARLLVRGST